MNISKRKQGILAIICTIAMIVTSITVYNPREAKAADTDYSALEFTKVTEAMDSTYAYCITDNTLIDFGKLNFYGVNYMQVIGSGNSKMDEATVTIDGVVQTNNDIAFDRSSAITGFIVSKLSDNAYHELKIEGEGGNITIVLKKGNVGGEIESTEEETTTGSSTEPFDPSTIGDSEWKLALNSKTVSYYIADGKSDKVSVNPQLEGDNYYVAFLLAAKFKSVTFDGESKDVEAGAFCRVLVSDLTSGYHTLVVTDHYGNESVTIYFKVAKEEETTTPEVTTPSFEEGKELIPSDKVNAEISLEKHTAGQLEYAQEHKADSIHIESGKWYVGQFTITSSVRKYFEIRIQDAAASHVSIPANTEFKKVLVEAGQTVNVRVRFKADRTTSSAIFDICMGYIKEESEAGTVQITNNSLKGYTDEPEATKYTVSIDGTEKTYEEGATITVPADGQGYYDAEEKVAYAPEEVITVDRNITVTSINLNVAMESGAGIKLTTPTGLRFKTNVTGTTDILSQSDIIKTGTIITASDILGEGTVDDDFVNSDKLKLNIENENNGWYGNTVGTFCASIVELQEANYARDFVGVGYVTIKYNNNTEKTIYAPSGTVRAVSTVAQNIKNSEAIYQDGMTYYDYLKSLGKDYDTIIDTYAAATKNNQ